MTQGTTTAETVVRSFFEAFGGGDIPGLLNLLTDDVEWNVPGASLVPWTGVRRGHAEVQQFFGILSSSADVQQFEIHNFVAQGDHVAVFGFFKWVVKATQRSFEGDWAIHFTVRGDKVAKYQIFENSYAIAEAFRA